MAAMMKPLSSLIGSDFHGKDVMVSGVALDSRLVEKGFLFCAVEGDLTDGHHFISRAIDRGAVAVAMEKTFPVDEASVSTIVSNTLRSNLSDIAAKFYNNPTQDLSVIGVTGTNGKTSISHYIHQLFDLLDVKCGEIGTLGVTFGDECIKTENTTPDAMSLQKYFYEMLQVGATQAVMEVSSHALVQKRCESVAFDTAIFSNISHDHLDYHGTLENYLNAKAQLFSFESLRLAVVNMDDAAVADIEKVLPDAARLIRYSLSDDNADVYLSNVNVSAGKTSATLHYLNESVEMQTGLLGAFNLYNLLASIIAVIEQGNSLKSVAENVSRVMAVPGRMQSVTNDSSITAIVDYAHTADALENVLESLKAITEGKLITVFGCGGDRDKEKRPLMAVAAEKYSDAVIVTSDNPRNESADAISQQVVKGFTQDIYQINNNREAAIVKAVTMASANDCIVVAGKGHEKTQLINGVEHAFDDVAVLQSAFLRKEALQ